MTKKILILLCILPLSIFAGSITVQDTVSTPLKDNSCFDRTFKARVLSKGLKVQNFDLNKPPMILSIP
ncbi:MAG: hypothetical protein Q9M39_09585 [Sulfurovum sp.]|nr:hypothetical protein [Sulfurovum sp.]